MLTCTMRMHQPDIADVLRQQCRIAVALGLYPLKLPPYKPDRKTPPTLVVYTTMQELIDDGWSLFAVWCWYYNIPEEDPDFHATFTIPSPGGLARVE